MTRPIIRIRSDCYSRELYFLGTEIEHDLITLLSMRNYGDRIESIEVKLKETLNNYIKPTKHLSPEEIEKVLDTVTGK